MGPRGKGKREGRERLREGGGRWDWDPSTRDGKGGKGNGGKDGVVGYVGKEREGRGREGEEISIHGLKLNVAPPMLYGCLPVWLILLFHITFNNAYIVAVGRIKMA